MALWSRTLRHLARSLVACVAASGVACGARILAEPPVVDDIEDAAVDASTRDAVVSAPPDVEVADAPEPVAPERRSTFDASTCLSPCDCDGDGYLAPDAGCQSDAAVDCDDHEPLAHPGAGYVDLVPTPPSKGDWNCDGRVEQSGKGDCALYPCQGDTIVERGACGTLVRTGQCVTQGSGMGCGISGSGPKRVYAECR